MKNFVILLLIGITSCKKESSVTEPHKEAFEKIARTFQNKYIEGSVNCDFIINFIDENIMMSESQFGKRNMSISYDQLVRYCPHLPQKQTINTITEQRLLNPNLGYDYVSQLYLRKSAGDTARETSVRIWENKNGTWKIIQMNNSLHKACDH